MSSIETALATLAEELRARNTPAQVRQRKQREARKMRYLAAHGILPPRSLKAALRAGRAFLEPSNSQASVAEFDDDIPF